MLFFVQTLHAQEQQDNLPDSFQQWERQNADREAREETVYGELWSKTLMLLVAILAFLFIATWFMKRFDRFKIKPQDKSTRILLIERKVLSPKSVIYLIEIDGSKIALSESATNGVQVLSALDAHKKSQIE